MTAEQRVGEEGKSAAQNLRDVAWRFVENMPEKWGKKERNWRIGQRRVSVVAELEYGLVKTIVVKSEIIPTAVGEMPTDAELIIYDPWRKSTGLEDLDRPSWRTAPKSENEWLKVVTAGLEAATQPLKDVTPEVTTAMMEELQRRATIP